MKALWIGQPYSRDLRECVFIDDDSPEQSTFYATDEEAREFAAEHGATIREASSYDAEMNLADPFGELWRERN